MNLGSSEFRAAAAKVALDPCLLCRRGGPNGIGVWLTDGDAARRLRAPEGKTRAVPYSLCLGCERRPDALDRVEKQILFVADPPPDVVVFGSDGGPWRLPTVKAAS